MDFQTRRSEGTNASVKLCVAYLAVCNGPITTDYCARFVTTWHEFPPGIETDLVVISNGGALSLEQSIMFSSLNAKMFARSNDGWDIAAHQEAARGPCADYDAVLWAGESVYFHRAGWLKRLADAFSRYGPGFYGVFSSNAITAHCNTTAYFCPPSLVKSYPKKVSTRADRYEYEHSNTALWRRAAQRGLPTKLVTFDGEYDPHMWRVPNNILWRGDQTNCLMWCNHSDGYAHADAETKREWARRSDQVFR